MPPRLRDFLQRWIITTVAVLIAAHVVPGIDYDHHHVQGLLVATLLLGLLNAFLRPVLVVATIGFLFVLNLLLGLRLKPLTIFLQFVLLGFLLLAINALLLLLVGRLVRSFHVDDFRAAFWGGLLISAATIALNSLTRTGNARVTFHRGPPPPPSGQSGGGDGPVIDV